MWAKEGIGSKLTLFGLREFSSIHDLLQSTQITKATGRNSKQNILQHPETDLQQQDTSWDTCGAGAVSSVMAVGLSGC